MSKAIGTTIGTTIKNYYDSKKTSIEKILSAKQEYTHKIRKNKNKKYVIEILDKDKIVLIGECALLGQYNTMSSMWHWGYAVDSDKGMLNESFKKNMEKFHNEIMDDFDNEKTANETEIEDLHYRTNNGYYYTSKDNVPNIVKIGLFVMNAEWVLPIVEEHKNNKMMRYIAITRIL